MKISEESLALGAATSQQARAIGRVRRRLIPFLAVELSPSPRIPIGPANGAGTSRPAQGRRRRRNRVDQCRRNLGGFTGPFLMGWMKDVSGDFLVGLRLPATGAVLSGLLVLTVASHARGKR